MKIGTAYSLCLLSLFLYSCKGTADQNIVGDYFLIKSDSYDNSTNLSYKVNADGDYVQVVGEYVFEAGANNKFIILKQHPSQPSGPVKLV